HRPVAGVPARPEGGRLPPMDLLRPPLRAPPFARPRHQDPHRHRPDAGRTAAGSPLVAARRHRCDGAAVSSVSWTEASADPATLAPDTLCSIRNTLALGGSLVATWTVALGVRLILPRHLGPESFGAFQFADAFTTAFFVVTSLGVETYIRKEVSTRREHASDFLGGLLLLRFVMTALVVAVMAALMHAAGRPVHLQRLVPVFAAYQFFNGLNETGSALRPAVGAVEGVAV